VFHGSLLDELVGPTGFFSGSSKLQELKPSVRIDAKINVNVARMPQHKKNSARRKPCGVLK
jgi:hypothetical protein